jgi:hypothetical protein
VEHKDREALQTILEIVAVICIVAILSWMVLTPIRQVTH